MASSHINVTFVAILLFCVFGAFGFTPYAGMRLNLNNSFVASTTHKMFPVGFKMLHDLLKNPVGIFICI